MLKDIISEHNLNCTEEELKAYMLDIPEIDFNLTHSIHSFDEKYNGVEIENHTGNPDAKYYIIQIPDGATYLQPHAPFVGGYEPITDDNVNELILKHKDAISESLNQFNKMHLAIEHFKS